MSEEQFKMFAKGRYKIINNQLQFQSMENPIFHRSCSDFNLSDSCSKHFGYYSTHYYAERQASIHYQPLTVTGILARKLFR